MSINYMPGSFSFASAALQVVVRGGYVPETREKIDSVAAHIHCMQELW